MQRLVSHLNTPACLLYGLITQSHTLTSLTGRRDICLQLVVTLSPSCMCMCLFCGAPAALSIFSQKHSCIRFVAPIAAQKETKSKMATELLLRGSNVPSEAVWAQVKSRQEKRSESYQRSVQNRSEEN